MVFGVQKGGFYIAKVWFLQCEVGILCMLLCYSELQVYVGAQFYGVADM